MNLHPIVIQEFTRMEGRFVSTGFLPEIIYNILGNNMLRNNCIVIGRYRVAATNVQRFSD